MEIKTLFGLPAHPLMVHIPVVLLPLAALGAILAIALPRFRRPFGWSVVVLTGVSTVFAKLAEGSGEALEETVRETAALEQHTELGSSMWLFAGAFFACALAYMLWDRHISRQAGASGADGALESADAAPSRRGQPAWVMPVLAVLVVLTGIGATARVIQVGHSGAKATWEDKKPATGGTRTGDGDGDHD